MIVLVASLGVALLCSLRILLYIFLSLKKLFVIHVLYYIFLCVLSMLLILQFLGYSAILVFLLFMRRSLFHYNFPLLLTSFFFGVGCWGALSGAQKEIWMSVTPMMMMFFFVPSSSSLYKSRLLYPKCRFCPAAHLRGPVGFATDIGRVIHLVNSHPWHGAIR